MSVAQPPEIRTLLFVWNEKYAGGGFFPPSSSSSSDRWMCFRAAGLGWALLAALHLSEYTSDAAVGEGFYLGSRFNTQQSTPKIDSTFEMPQTPVRCGFKVQNGIATPPCLGWIKKKEINILSSPSLQLCAFISAATDVSSASKRVFFFPSSFFRRLVVWSQVKNYPEKNTLCQPAARRAHKQDHLAIISSQPQIRAAKQTFIRKNGRRGEE